jgi:hypothetical protein
MQACHRIGIVLKRLIEIDQHNLDMNPEPIYRYVDNSMVMEQATPASGACSKSLNRFVEITLCPVISLASCLRVAVLLRH